MTEHTMRKESKAPRINENLPRKKDRLKIVLLISIFLFQYNFDTKIKKLENIMRH